MSTFIHDDGTFDKIYSTIKHYNLDFSTFDGDLLTLIRAIRESNYKSVDFRYKETNTRSEYSPLSTSPLNKYEFIKILNSLKYQSCEHPEWETSTEKRVIDELIADVSYDIISASENYSKAPWEYNRSSNDKSISLMDLIK